MEPQNVIGLTLSETETVLKRLGQTKIKVVTNSVPIKSSELVVCKQIQKNDEITLVCGEFVLDVNGGVQND